MTIKRMPLWNFDYIVAYVGDGHTRHRVFFGPWLLEWFE